jgi:CHAT domain-containing protein
MITGQDLRQCRLVYLAACSSGSGEKYGSVNAESLVHSLLNAGVARVVATGWNVDSASAARMTGAFYGHLLAGVDAAEAMRRTAGEIRRNSTTSHPYYWAGYQVFGYK